MTRTKKILLGTAAAVAVLGTAAVVTHSVAHDRGGYGMKRASYGMGHNGGPRRAMRIHNVFDAVDADKDGTVTAEELTKYRTDKVAAADANGDGNLQIEEFQTIWLEVMRPRMVDHFQFLDDDGDGQISEAEIVTPLAMVTRRMDRNDDGAIGRDELRRKRHGWHDGRWHRDGDDDRRKDKDN